MMTKNNSLFVLILIFLFVETLLAAVVLIIEVTLGYGGFQQFHGSANIVTLQPGCSNSYFQQKYGQAPLLSIKVAYIYTLAASFLSLLSILSLILFMCQHFGKNIDEKQSTQTDQVKFHWLQRYSCIDRPYPTLFQTSVLYVLVSGVVLSSFVPFKIYLQIWTDFGSNICSLSLNQTQVVVIYILNLVGFIIAVIVLIFLLLMISFVRERQFLMNRESDAEISSKKSKRIEQRLESQRRCYIGQGQKPYQQNLSPNCQGNVSCEEQPNKERERGLQDIRMTTSIVYRQKVSINLQSVCLQE